MSYSHGQTDLAKVGKSIDDRIRFNYDAPGPATYGNTNDAYQYINMDSTDRWPLMKPGKWPGYADPVNVDIPGPGKYDRHDNFPMPDGEWIVVHGEYT